MAISSAAQGGAVHPAQGSAVLGAGSCFVAQLQADDISPWGCLSHKVQCSFP